MANGKAYGANSSALAEEETRFASMQDIVLLVMIGHCQLLLDSRVVFLEYFKNLTD